jgi:hypothetical protein
MPGQRQSEAVATPSEDDPEAREATAATEAGKAAQVRPRLYTDGYQFFTRPGSGSNSGNDAGGRGGWLAASEVQRDRRGGGTGYLQIIGRK